MTDVIAQHAALAISTLAGLRGQVIYLETQQGQVLITGVMARMSKDLQIGGDSMSGSGWMITTTQEAIPDTVQRLTGMTVSIDGDRKTIVRAHEMSGGVLILELGR